MEVSHPNASTRVLHVHSGNLRGGVEKYLRTIARCRMHAPSMHTDFAICFEGRFGQELRDVGATVHILGAARMRFPVTIAAARRALGRHLRNTQADIVVCHSAWSYSLFAPVIRSHGLRLVYHMHDIPNPRRWLDRWASLTRPDLVLCYSSFVEAAGRWIFPAVPRKVVAPPGVLEAGGDGADRWRLRASLGAGRDDVVILNASRMEAWKGHGLLVEALARLRDHPRWVCWIAGGAQRPSEVSYERALRSTTARLDLSGRVKFLGQRDDVASLMAAAEIHCQPNVSPEPFGQVFVEALLSRLPVVTTDMGGARDIVDETCGRLVKPNADALAAALQELIERADRRSALSEAGHARARAWYDPQARMKELETTFANMRGASQRNDARARPFLLDGHSSDVILSVVASALARHAARFDNVVDLGCGPGRASGLLDEGFFRTYTGCDVARYDGFTESLAKRFCQVDLNQFPYPLSDASADLVIALDAIVQVENHRGLVREMARIVRPGGWVVFAIPDQPSLMGKLSLAMRRQSRPFHEAPSLYPAHTHGFAEEDVRRITREAGLTCVELRYTDRGRVLPTSLSWPRSVGGRRRWFNDNVVVLARRPSVEC